MTTKSFILLFILIQSVTSEGKSILEKNCILPPNENANDEVRYCFKPQISAEFISDFSNQESRSLITGGYYLGIHLNPFLSFHAKELYSQLKNIEQKSKNISKSDESVLLKIGNLSFHSMYLTVGHQSLPFGLNANPFKGYFYNQEDKYFGRSSKNTAILAIDNRFDTTIELGASTTSLKPTEEHIYSSSIRISTDSSSLEGTRFVGSLNGDSNGLYHFGFGVINKNKRKEIIHIEFIKSKIINGDFQQLIRLGYKGYYRKKQRTIVLYDHVRLKYHQGTIGQDFQVTKRFSLTVRISYKKSEDNKQVIVSSGVEAQL